MAAVWPDSIVEENNLAQAISKLRQVFGETPGSHSYIVTVPGRGYRFVAEVMEKTADAADAAATPEPKTFESVTTEAGKLSGSPARSRATRLPLQSLPAKTGWLWAAAISAIFIVSLVSWFFVRHRPPGSSAGHDQIDTALHHFVDGARRQIDSRQASRRGDDHPRAVGRIRVLVKVETLAAWLVGEADDAMTGVRIRPLARRFFRRRLCGR